MHAQIRPVRFALLWCLGGIAVLPLSVLLTAAVVDFSDTLLSQINDRLAPDIGTPAPAIFWLVTGICIGFLQKAIVKRNLRVDLGRWTVYSSLGSLLAGAIAYPCLEDACLPPSFSQYRADPDLSATVVISLVVLLYLTVLSAAQCLALNRLVRGSWRWIAAHAGSLMLVFLALLLNQMSPEPFNLNAWFAVVITVISVTVASGLVMLRLLTSRRRASKRAIDQWAFQPAAIETQSAGERSVWNGAT